MIYSLTIFYRYIFNGIVSLYRSSTLGRSSSIWNEAVRLLEGRYSVFFAIFTSLTELQTPKPFRYHSRFR